MTGDIKISQEIIDKPEKTVNLAYLASIKWFHRKPTFSEVSVISFPSSLYEKLSKLVKNIGMLRDDVVGSPVIEGAIFDKILRICRMEKENLIKLPPRLLSANNEKKRTERTKLNETSLVGTVKDYSLLKLKLLTDTKDYKFWNSIIHTYHYQGYQIIVGKFLKYITYIDDMPIACLGWGSAAWSIARRDQWIGWNKSIKDKNLGKVVNNIRFLILPWVRIKYLASLDTGQQI